MNRVITVFGLFPFGIVFFSCLAKSRDIFLRKEFGISISNEIFHVLDFVPMDTCTVLYYFYGYYCNPNNIFC